MCLRLNSVFFLLVRIIVIWVFTRQTKRNRETEIPGAQTTVNAITKLVTAFKKPFNQTNTECTEQNMYCMQKSKN